MSLHKWFPDPQVGTFSGIGEYFENDPFRFPLQKILNLDEDNLKPFSVELFGGEGHPDFVDYIIEELEWAYRAYIQFLDIQEIRLDLVTPMENRHFCFYESIVYLRESCISWIDKNVLASLILLRPFMELSIFHIYWYIRCEEDDYSKYYAWLESGKGKPPFRNMFDYVFAKVPTRQSFPKEWIRGLKNRLWETYKSLCVYNHTPNLDESLTAQSRSFENPAFAAFMDCQRLIIILVTDLIYLYIAAFPLSLFPIDIYRKWAFSGPVGTFFHPMNTKIISKLLGEDSVESLREYLSDFSKVQGHLEWANSQIDKTDEEIMDDWQEFRRRNNVMDDASSMKEAIAKERSLRRALGWQSNYVVGSMQWPIAI